MIRDLRHLNDWLNFGLYLGLEHSSLTRLEKQHHYDVSRCRMEMLQLWLDGNPTPTWNKVIDALRAVGCDNQALEIAKKRSGGGGKVLTLLLVTITMLSRAGIIRKRILPISHPPG